MSFQYTRRVLLGRFTLLSNTRRFLVGKKKKKLNPLNLMIRILNHKQGYVHLSSEPRNQMIEIHLFTDAWEYYKNTFSLLLSKTLY